MCLCECYYHLMFYNVDIQQKSFLAGVSVCRFVFISQVSGQTPLQDTKPSELVGQRSTDRDLLTEIYWQRSTDRDLLTAVTVWREEVMWTDSVTQRQSKQWNKSRTHLWTRNTQILSLNRLVAKSLRSSWNEYSESTKNLKTWKKLWVMFIIK